MARLTTDLSTPMRGIHCWCICLTGGRADIYSKIVSLFGLVVHRSSRIIINSRKVVNHWEFSREKKSFKEN